MTQTIQSLRDQDNYQKSIDRQVQDDIAKAKAVELIDITLRIHRLKQLFLIRNLRHNEVSYLFQLIQSMNELLEEMEDKPCIT